MKSNYCSYWNSCSLQKTEEFYKMAQLWLAYRMGKNNAVEYGDVNQVQPWCFKWHLGQQPPLILRSLLKWVNLTLSLWHSNVVPLPTPSWNSFMCKIYDLGPKNTFLWEHSLDFNERLGGLWERAVFSQCGGRLVFFQPLAAITVDSVLRRRSVSKPSFVCVCGWRELAAKEKFNSLVPERS